MTAAPDWEIVSDADLACAAASGDRQAFAGIYLRYADRLHDFCVGMLGDRDAAADCVQDAFCTAASTLVQLRDPAKLRPWLYAVARSEALRRLRQRRREQVADVLPEEASDEAGPDALASRTELAEMLSQAAGGLSDRDRSVLELAYRHGLDGPELAAALDVSPDHARKLAQRLRETIERSLGALLVARRARGAPNGCPELRAMLRDWDGQFTILMRKRISRHIDSCESCQLDRSELVNPVALLGTAPVFIPAPVWLRDATLNQIQLGTGTLGAGGGAESSPPAPPSRAAARGSHSGLPAIPNQPAPSVRRRSDRRLALLGLLALLAIAGLLAVGVRRQSDMPVGPANLPGNPELPWTPAQSTAQPVPPPPVVGTTANAITSPPQTWSPPPTAATTSAYAPPPPATSLPRGSTTPQTTPPTTFFAPTPRVTGAPPTSGGHKKPPPPQPPPPPPPLP